MYTAGLGRFMLRANLALLALWGLWGVVYTVVDAFGVEFLNFLAFGLISPLVGAVCLLISFVGLLQAWRAGTSRLDAVLAIVLSIVIGLLPIWWLLQSCDGPCYS